MKILYISFRFLWKRKLLNVLVLLQVVFSILCLAQTLSKLDHLMSTRGAVEKLETDGVYILRAFSHIQGVFANKASNALKPFAEIGRLYVKSEESADLVGYSDEIIRHYQPALASGRWFADYEPPNGVIPIVTNAGMKLRVNDTILLPSGIEGRVIAVLDPNTQYLFPQKGASPEFYSADNLLSNDGAVMIIPYSMLPEEEQRTFMPWTEMLIYAHDNVERSEIDRAVARTGELTTMASAKDIYENKMRKDLYFNVTLFLIFFLAAVAGIGGTCMMQNIYNQKIFSIYYLTGMTPKKSAAIEATRLSLLLMLSIALIFVLAAMNMWDFLGMSERLKRYIYPISFLYLAIVYGCSSIGFILSLARGNIVDMIKKFRRER
ncbi:MAG: hypothetical protein LBH86_02425 [Oscillospiraceae bacterium]|jgi:hypothetical protein|nr:hypothetical protein [Oscillospiraceae bacterium]